MHEKMGVDGKEDFVFVKLCVHVDRNTSVFCKIYDCSFYYVILSLYLFSEFFSRDKSCGPHYSEVTFRRVH